MATIKPDAVADPRPGSRGYLRWYWTRGPGLAKWRGSPHPWTALRRHLIKYIPASYVNQVVSAWFEDVFGYPPSARQGRNPVGKG
ncbi:hypothetical protein [Rathayibacter sp. Leaf248]|uniref:hypothetical protein n=1 Tax=Rathayibacter sp. Leaf248 TaxID=2876555 RepID=UPI001E627425|nr:hypothetical protein [Rathayibacter sp. Leaf248]